MIIELIDDGARGFSADGMKQIGDLPKFSRFAKVDPFDAFGFGQQVEEDEELLLGEDPFLLSLGSFAEGGLQNDPGVVLVAGMVVGILHIGATIVVLIGMIIMIFGAATVVVVLDVDPVIVVLNVRPVVVILDNDGLFRAGGPTA